MQIFNNSIIHEDSQKVKVHRLDLLYNPDFCQSNIIVKSQKNQYFDGCLGFRNLQLTTTAEIMSECST